MDPQAEGSGRFLGQEPRLACGQSCPPRFLARHLLPPEGMRWQRPWQRVHRRPSTREGAGPGGGGTVQAGVWERPRQSGVLPQSLTGAARNPPRKWPCVVMTTKGLLLAWRARIPHTRSLSRLLSDSISDRSLFVRPDVTVLLGIKASVSAGGCGPSQPCMCMSGHPRWLSSHQASPQSALLSSGDSRSQDRGWPHPGRPPRWHHGHCDPSLSCGAVLGPVGCWQHPWPWPTSCWQ